MTLHEKYSENAATTAALMEAGIELMRQNIKRSYPALPLEQRDELLSAWLWRTDDPVPGDIVGHVRVREMTP
jgi:hypothetical protein